MFLWSKLSNVKWEDAWEERFAGYDGLVISRLAGQTRIRVELYCEREQEALRVQEMWGGSVRELKQQNWVALGTPHIEPIKIRDCLLVVCDTDEQVLEGLRERFPRRRLVQIPIEMAFGTGDHATTSSVLRLLVDVAREREDGWSMADVGCGTGLLAIAGKCLGAGRVEGFDYDEHAVQAARRNAPRNGVEVEFAQADLMSWMPEAGGFEVIAANVFADALVQGMENLARALAAGGVLLLSGILRVDLDRVVAALEQQGLELVKVVKKGRWCSLRVQWA